MQRWARLQHSEWPLPSNQFVTVQHDNKRDIPHSILFNVLRSITEYLIKWVFLILIYEHQTRLDNKWIFFNPTAVVDCSLRVTAFHLLIYDKMETPGLKLESSPQYIQPQAFEFHSIFSIAQIQTLLVWSTTVVVLPCRPLCQCDECSLMCFFFLIGSWTFQNKLFPEWKNCYLCSLAGAGAKTLTDTDAQTYHSAVAPRTHPQVTTAWQKAGCSL